MIGKSLNERHKLGTLSAESAIATLQATLAEQAKPLIEVRAQDARMIACLIVRADKLAVRLCRSMGFDLKQGATAVFGLLGSDVVRFFTDLGISQHQKSWLEAPCGPRETKVLLVAGGVGLLSIETNEGKVSITAAP
jgi:hypothetical protein